MTESSNLINKEISEKVFGLTMIPHKDGELIGNGHWCQDGWHHAKDDPAYLLMDRLASEFPNLRHENGAHEGWCEDIQCAMKVVDHLTTLGYTFSCNKKKDFAFEVAFISDYNLNEVLDSNLAKAICLSALKALENSKI